LEKYGSPKPVTGSWRFISIKAQKSLCGCGLKVWEVKIQEDLDQEKVKNTRLD